MIPVSGYRPPSEELKADGCRCPEHTLREAVDFALEENGVLNYDGNADAYKTLADEAIKLGLTPGYYFHERDAGHIQLNPRENNDYFKGLDQC